MSEAKNNTSAEVVDSGKDELESVTERLEQGLEVKDRRYHLKSYKNCFVGSDAVQFMVSSGLTSTEEDALLLGNLLLDAGYIAHVLREHKFENKHLFYRFTKHEDHGAPGLSGISVSLSVFAPSVEQGQFAFLPPFCLPWSFLALISSCLASRLVQPMRRHRGPNSWVAWAITLVTAQ